MAGKLSFAQEQALINLHRGDPFGIDARVERGLRIRGLVYTSYWNATFPEKPFLTPAGAVIAAELDLAERERAGERRVRGTRFGVIEGGLTR